MKELFSSFSAAVFYPLVSLVLPGLTAISAWFIWSMRFPALSATVGRNHTETAFVLMLMAISFGIIIDDLGMRIESSWLDRRRELRTNGKHFVEWWAYLRKPFSVEPSGRRHLRQLVARLKFELGIPVGLIFTTPALWLSPTIHIGASTILTGGAVIVIMYLWFEAASTHEVLGKLRHELLNDAETIDFAAKKNVSTVAVTARNR